MISNLLKNKKIVLFGMFITLFFTTLFFPFFSYGQTPNRDSFTSRVAEEQGYDLQNNRNWEGVLATYSKPQTIIVDGIPYTFTEAWSDTDAGGFNKSDIYIKGIGPSGNTIYLYDKDGEGNFKTLSLEETERHAYYNDDDKESGNGSELPVSWVQEISHNKILRENPDWRLIVSEIDEELTGNDDDDIYSIYQDKEGNYHFIYDKDGNGGPNGQAYDEITDSNGILTDEHRDYEGVVKVRAKQINEDANYTPPVDGFVGAANAGYQAYAGTARRVGLGDAVDSFSKFKADTDGGIIDNIANDLLQGLGWIITKITTFLLWLSALLLNTVIKTTIVDMKSFVDEGSGINTAWTVFRDISNICFIFVLLYIAIKTILGGISSETKKMIGTVIIIATLINFSLFFTKVIIDVSNLLTLGFVDSISESVNSNETEKAWLFDGHAGGLSDAFVTPLGIHSLEDRVKGSGADSLAIAVLSGIFFIITAFVFFLVSTLLITRLVVFIFVLVASPVAFMSWVVPGTKKLVWDKWLSALSGQALFAPVFFAFAWVILRLMNSPVFQKNLENKSFSQLFSGPEAAENAIGLVMNFVIATALMLAAVMTAKSISDNSGKGIATLSGKIGVGLGALTAGTAGWATRNTAGRLAATVDRHTDGNNAFSRFVKARAQNTAKRSFDIRGTKSFQGIAGTVGAKGAGGKAGGKGGYEQQLKDSTKKRAEFASSLGSKGQELYTNPKGFGKISLLSASKRNLKRTTYGEIEKQKERNKLVKKATSKVENNPVYKNSVKDADDARIVLKTLNEQLAKERSSANPNTAQINKIQSLIITERDRLSNAEDIIKNTEEIIKESKSKEVKEKTLSQALKDSTKKNEFKSLEENIKKELKNKDN